MATVGSLVIRLQTDATGLRTGLEAGSRLIRQFGRNAAETILPEGAVIHAGQRAAAQLVSGLTNKLAAERGRIDAAFAAGKLNESEWRTQGLRARLAFNQGLIAGERELQQTHNISANTSHALISQLDTAAEAANQRAIAREQQRSAATLAEAASRERQMVALHERALAMNERMDRQAAARKAQSERQAATAAARAQRDIVRNAVDPRLTDMQSPAVQAADALIRRARDAQENLMRQTRYRIASGAIDPKDAEKASAEAATRAYAAYNRTLVEGLNKLEGIPGYNANVRNAVVDAMKITGRNAANALGETFKRTSQQTGSEAATELSRQFIGKATQSNRVAAVARTMTLAMTAPIVAAGVASTRVMQEFQNSMLLLQSRTNATASELRELEQVAKRIGAETVFTGAQVAETQAQLAMRGGFGVSDILKNTQPVIQLAASQMTDLATATSAVISTLHQFGLEADSTQRVVDVLAKGVQLSGSSIEDFQTALKYVGPPARAAGLSLEETVAALALLARGGRGASLAGTSLNQMLESLQNPTKRQTELLLNQVDVIDENTGKMRPLVQVLGQLEKAALSAGQTYAQFGVRAGTGAQILLQEGASALQQFTNEIAGSTGTVARQAAITMSGLKGTFSELQGAVENLGLAFAESGLTRSLTFLVEQTTRLVRALGDAPPAFVMVTTGVLAFAAVAGPLVYTIMKLRVAYFTLTASLYAYRAAQLLTAEAAGVATTAAAGATLGFTAMGAAITGGVILVALGALALYLHNAGEEARKAKQNVEEYQAVLDNIGDRNISSLSAEFNNQSRKLQEQQAEQQRLLNEVKTLPAKLGDVNKQEAARIGKEIEAQIVRVQMARAVLDRALDASAKSQLAAQQAAEKTKAAGKPGNDNFPISALGNQGKSAVDLFVDRVREMVELLQAARASGADVTQPMQALRALLPEIDAQLARVPDRFNKGAADATKLLRAAESIRNEFRAMDRERVEGIINSSREVIEQFNLLQEQQRAATEAGERFGLDPAIIASEDLNSVMGRLVARAAELQTALAQAVTDPLSESNERAAQLQRQLVANVRAMNQVREEQRRTAVVENLRANPMRSVPGSRVLAPPPSLGNLVPPGFRATLIDLSNAASRGAQEVQEFGETIDGTIPFLRRLGDGVGTVLRAVDSISHFAADPSGFLSGLVSRREGGAVDVGKTLGNVANAVGSVVAAVGVVQGVIGVFTAGQREQQAIQLRNLEALREIQTTLELQGRGASAQVLARNVLGDVLRNNNTSNDPVSSLRRFEDLQRRLADAGLSLDALKTIANDLGIDLNVLSAQSLATLNTALGLVTQNVGRFNNSLESQRQRQSLHDNVFDVAQSPVRTIQTSIALFQRMNPALANIFKGLDATTEAGRAQIKAVLQNLVSIIETTGLTAEQLGNFESLDDLISVILDIEGGFDELADTTNKLNDALTNIPTGFRVAFRTYQNIPQQQPGGPGLVPQPITPPRQPMPGNGGVTGASVDNSVTITGDVTIVADAGETSTEAMDRWVRRKRQQARGAGERNTDAWVKYA